MVCVPCQIHDTSLAEDIRSQYSPEEVYDHLNPRCLHADGSDDEENGNSFEKKEAEMTDLTGAFVQVINKLSLFFFGWMMLEKRVHGKVPFVRDIAGDKGVMKRVVRNGFGDNVPEAAFVQSEWRVGH